MPALQVDVYSHNFHLNHYDQDLGYILANYSRRNLAQWGPVRAPGGRVSSEIKCEFIAATSNHMDYGFLTSQYDEIMAFVTAYGYSADTSRIIKHPAPEGVAVTFELREEFVPRSYQPPIIRYLVAPGCNKVVELQTGKGKLQPLDAAIRIPGGWTTMGELKVGSVITAKDGTPTKVRAIFPHGQKQIYKVTFADGRSTECGAEHLWKVYYVNTVKHRRWRVVDTMEMLRLISMPNPRVYVPLIDPEDRPDVDLPMDPYLLGVLLGDGGMSQATVTITTPDQFIVDGVNDLLKRHGQKLKFTNRYGYNIVFDGPIVNDVKSVKSVLQQLKLHGSLSYHKFIPDMYLEGSLEQRWSLLQGLMDTDGTSNTRETGGAISYSTSSYELALGVQYLVRSLGGIAKITTRVTSYTHNGETRQSAQAYEVNIRVKAPSRLFRLPRKKERTNDNNQYAEELKLRVVSIEPTGFKETQCIEVDHPEHLYVTDGFTVTHNTALALKATQEIGTRTFLIIRPMYIDKWIGDVEAFFVTEPGDVMVIKGGASLKRLIELGQADELKAKFIICSNATLRMFLEEHEQYNGEVSSYGVSPSELCAVLKVGLVIFDEVHQDFHFNYRMFSYINVKKTIALSATLDPDDRTLKRRYQTAFPMELRSPPVEYDKYIEVQALFYSMESMNKVRYKNFFGQYQHVMYEQSILKDSKRMENYRRMIARVLKFDYIRVAQPGMRCVIYFATVDMCTQMQEYLSKVFPDRVIRRYVSEDDYHTNLMGAEIIVTTLQSAGTAVDIPNLAVNIMTVALNSKQSNIQGLGRLRRLKDFPDFTPKFVYLVCTSIDKHIKYHQEKLTKFEGKVLSHKELQTDFRI